jgi:phospholipase/carboxylesterase
VLGSIDEKNVVPGLSAAADRLAIAIRGWQSSATAGRPIVTGFSQGGMLSFALSAKYPSLIAEAVPISGLMPPSMIPTPWPAAAPMPRIFALHGEADQRVPFDLSKMGVEKLRAAGVQAELKSYPGVGHTVSPDMRRDLFVALGAAVDREAAR